MSAPFSTDARVQKAAEPRFPWLGFILVSAFIHAGLWGIRDWFSLPEEDLPRPPTPIEVSLVPATTAQGQTTQTAESPPRPVTPPPPKAPPKPRPAPTPKPKAAPPRDPPERDRPPERSTSEPVPVTPAREVSAPPTPGTETQNPRGDKAQKPDTASSDYVGPKPASHMNNPKPAYPSLAIRRQWEGKVSLRVFVKASGTVGEVQIASSSGHEILDEAAVEAVRQWRFVPAKRGGQAVDSWVTFPINWNLENSR